jgi:hypothetical protein
MEATETMTITDKVQRVLGWLNEHSLIEQLESLRVGNGKAQLAFKTDPVGLREALAGQTADGELSYSLWRYDCETEEFVILWYERAESTQTKVKVTL